MKRYLSIATACALLAAGSASAQTYLGIGTGASRTDTHKNSWNLYGGVQVNPAFGLEVGYMDLGRYRGSNVQSWSVAGTGTLPIGETWSLLGKLGATANRTHFADTSNQTELLVGVGVGFKMNKNIGLRLEYDDFGKLTNTINGDNSRARNLGLSLKYAY